MKNLFKTGFVLLALGPVVAFAQVTNTASTGSCAARENVMFLLCKIGEILSGVIPVLIGLGVVYFVWGVIMYMIADGEEAKTKGRDQIIYGIIGLVVIISLWGLVRIVTNTLQLSGNAPTKTEINDLLPGRD